MRTAGILVSFLAAFPLIQAQDTSSPPQHTPRGRGPHPQGRVHYLDRKEIGGGKHFKRPRKYRYPADIPHLPPAELSPIPRLNGTLLPVAERATRLELQRDQHHPQ